MIPSNRYAARSSNRTINIKNVIGRFSPNINYKSTTFLALTVQANLSGSDRRKNNIINIKRYFSNTFNTVLNTSPHPVHNMVISLKLSP